jgi:hypothetical protein
LDLKFLHGLSPQVWQELQIHRTKAFSAEVDAGSATRKYETIGI